jgi:hypothetical protein
MPLGSDVIQEDFRAAGERKNQSEAEIQVY